MSNQDDNQPAIDTSDNSGAAPVSPLPMTSAQPGAIETPVEDDSGTSPAAPQPQAAGAAPPQNGDVQTPGGSQPQGPLGGVAKMIMGYLSGARAAPPQTLDQMAQQVDPEGKLSPGDRNLLAIDHVRDTKGDNAASALLQSNYVAYNAKTTFAKAALNGTQQKPADINAAIDAANQAEQHVLDGSNIKFATDPAQGGVTATVTMHGSTQPTTIALSPQAFSKWLDVGADGQWDKVMDASAPATLQRLAQQYPAPMARAGATPPPRVPQQKGTPVIGEEEPSPGPGTDVNNAPAKDGWSKRWDDAADPNNQTLEARADRIFGANNSATNRQRNEWIEAQKSETAKLENAVDVADARGQHAEEIARITGTGRQKVAETNAGAKVESSKNYSQARIEQGRQKLEAAVKHEEAVRGRSEQSNAMRGIVGMINAGRFSDLNPQQKQMFEQMTGGGQQPAPAQQQRPAQSGSPGQPPVQGAKFYQGKWYTRGSNGESVPVQ